jgi:RNA polymerase sigma-70 factor (ECF subfamily)
MVGGGPPVDSLSDDALLTGFAAGDARLSVAFVRRFQRKVFGIAVAVIAHDNRLAEDVTQQAFERAWRHASVYDARRGTVGAWLGRITHNIAVDVVRTRRASPVDPSDLDALLQTITATPEGAALQAESAAELRAAIRTLPAAQARALLMAAYRGMTAREIADVEEVPLGTAKTRVRTAMIRLREALDPGPPDGQASAGPPARGHVQALGPTGDLRRTR